MPFADNARRAALPGHRGEGGEIAHGHEIRPVRLDAHAPDRETRESGTRGEDAVEVRDRHRLRLGDAVNIDELRQHVFHALLHEPALRILRGFKARYRAELGAKLRDRRVAAIVQVHRDSLHRLSLVEKAMPLLHGPTTTRSKITRPGAPKASSQYVHEFIDMQQ